MSRNFFLTSLSVTTVLAFAGGIAAGSSPSALGINWEVAGVVGTAIGTIALAVATSALAFSTWQDVSATKQIAEAQAFPMVIPTPMTLDGAPQKSGFIRDGVLWFFPIGLWNVGPVPLFVTSLVLKTLETSFDFELGRTVVVGDRQVADMTDIRATSESVEDLLTLFPPEDPQAGGVLTITYTDASNREYTTVSDVLVRPISIGDAAAARIDVSVTSYVRS